MCDKDTRLIAYAEELGIDTKHLTLSDLIESHRHLRSAVQTYRDAENAVHAQVRERVISQAREQVLNGEYIAVAALAKMSIAELSTFIYEHDI